MTALVLVFPAHQPRRLRNYRYLEIGESETYFDDDADERIVRRLARRCYRPMNAILLEAIARTGGEFRCAFALSGVLLEQLEAWAPDVLDSFRALVETGCVELVAEPDHHSLACLDDDHELPLELGAHIDRIEELFGLRPTTVRNPAWIAGNAIATRLESLGFDLLLAEGHDPLCGERAPRRLGRFRGTTRQKVLLRDWRRSDDLALRFGIAEWSRGPGAAPRWVDRLRLDASPDDIVGVFLDYETFGEHRDAVTGILDFARDLPRALLTVPGARFATPSQIAAELPAPLELDAPEPISGAGPDRDLSPWLGNGLQRAARAALLDLRPRLRASGPDGAQLLEKWRRMTTSDHLRYMCTSDRADRNVHVPLCPHEAPHDAYIAFMNVLGDLAGRVRGAEQHPL